MNSYSAFAIVILYLCLAGSLSAQAPPAKADDEPRVRILVPTVDLPPHYRFQDSKQFTLIEWPKSRLREDVSDTITSFDQLKGKTSRHYKLKPNEPMYNNDLAEEDALRNGEVAHALTLSREGSAGFLHKGNRVDVMATVPADQFGNSARTMFVLENIEVLDVNSEKSKDAAGVQSLCNRILLRLTRPQSLLLKSLQETTKIDAVRRKTGDPQSIMDVYFIIPVRDASNAPATPEQQVLDRWLGSWNITYRQLKTEWTPEEKTVTAEEVITRVIGGKYIQEDSVHSDKTMNRSIITYDTQKKVYRSWWFSSTGQTDTSTGTWDAGQKTMTWSSTGNPDSTTTVKQHFKDDDTIVFDVVSKDRDDKMLFHMEGKSIRMKPTK